MATVFKTGDKVEFKSGEKWLGGEMKAISLTPDGKVLSFTVLDSEGWDTEVKYPGGAETATVLRLVGAGTNGTVAQTEQHTNGDSGAVKSDAQQATTTVPASYKAGDKVEVRVNGEWKEGEYQRDLSIYSNMKATPHSVSYKLFSGSGSGNFSDADIRPWTGTLKSPLGARVEPAGVDLRALEAAIINEVNEMRTNPTAYATKLGNLKSRYKLVEGKWYLDRPDEGAEYLGTSEADKADHERWLDETIAALQQCGTLSKLEANSQLRGGADFIASDTGKINGPAHTDSLGRGAQERAQLAGYTGGVNECISGDQRTAFGNVSSLLIDWKVDSRGHRKNLMNKDVKRIGVACQYFPEKQDGEWTIGAFIRTVIQCGY